MITKAAILAGGFNDRLKPFTLASPIGLMPVLNQPLLLGMFRHLRRQGIGDILLNTYRMPHQIERRLAPAVGDGLRVTYVVEQPPFGSMSTLKRSAGFFSGDFLLIMGDVISDADLRPLFAQHRERGALLTVAVSARADGRRYGTAVWDDNQRLINVARQRQMGEREAPLAGIYVVSPDLFDWVPESQGYDLGRHLLPALMDAEAPVFVEPIDGYTNHINSFTRFFTVNLDALGGEIRGWSSGYEREPYPGQRIGEGAEISPQAQLRGPVVIGPRCRIEAGAVIEQSIIEDGSVIGQGALLRQCVVFRRTAVGPGINLQRCLIRGDLIVQADSGQISAITDSSVVRPIQWQRRWSIPGEWLDRVLALLALVVLSPLFLLIALLIRLDSRGPALFRQLRVGQVRSRTSWGTPLGGVFPLYKFRTMQYNPTDGPHRPAAAGDSPALFEKQAADPRVTRVGSFLRATSLDELPQLINVVKGDIRLVGNRPLPLWEAEQLSEEWQMLRFNAPAGMTGLWQISGRSDLSPEERMVLDNYYAITHSFWGNWQIVLKTIPAVLRRRGAR